MRSSEAGMALWGGDKGACGSGKEAEAGGLGN